MKLLHDPELRQAFDGLLGTYADLLIGDDSPESVEKVKLWALYSHIHKTMPSLASHWNEKHPDGKAAVRELFEEIKRLNQNKQAKKQSAPPPTST